MSSQATLAQTVLGALQGSAAVLLTIAAGFASARAGLLDHASTRRVSNLASLVFLPCLLVVQMGPQLTPRMLRAVWIIPVWGFATTLVSHAFGWLGKKVFKLPNWTIVATGRANSSALPLLLLDSLGNTGVLDALQREGESTSETLDRAKSLILLNVIVQQVFTFATGPSILTNGDDKDEDDRLLPGPNPRGPTIQDQEHVGLLRDHDGMDDEDADPYRIQAPLRKLQHTPDVHWPARLRFLEKPAKKLAGFVNPPVVGGILAVIFGMIGPLHRAFLDKDGAFYASITSAVKNIGELFVALQMFVVGAQLQIVKSAHPGVKPTAYVLLVRFFIMPLISIGFVYLTAGRGIYEDDPLVWFLLVLIPSGPSAMILASLAELVNTDQGPIAGYLIVAYVFSPLISLTCTAGLAVVQHISSSRLP